MEIKAGKLLSQVNLPADLRKLGKKQLTQLCKELRNFIVDDVSVNGGHFGASLGVVELTVALHYVFNTPEDQRIELKPETPVVKPKSKRGRKPKVKKEES